MEPRPERPRSKPEQPRPQPPRATAAPPVAAHPSPSPYAPNQDEVDPTTVIAPPRTDYDYSPLDLAPPGVRRRRQIAAAVLGALGAVILLTLGAFAYTLLREDDPETTTSGLAATQAALTDQMAALAAQQTSVAEGAASAPVAGLATPLATTEPVAAEVPAASPESDDAASDDEETTDPTPPAPTSIADALAGLSAASGDNEPADEEVAADDIGAGELTAYLPSESDVPAGLSQDPEDVERELEEVATELGGQPQDVENLETWGWNGNIQRTFSAADPASLVADATTALSVSVHGFANAEAASEALVYFSDVLVSLGYTEVEVPPVGDQSRALQVTGDDGGTNEALYFQDGSYVVRLGGFSPAGDPTDVLVSLGQQLVEEA